MSFRIIRDDITRVSADIIVNSANPRPICGGSTEAHIYDVAGYDELLEARKQVGALEIGELGVTPAFRLPARNIIHISAPWWDGENPEESKETLKLCYVAVIKKALELKASSIAFPLLSSGVYRFPKAVALDVAAEAIKLYGAGSLDVTLVVYDEESYAIASDRFPDVRDYLGAENFCLKCASIDFPMAGEAFSVALEEEAHYSSFQPPRRSPQKQREQKKIEEKAAAPAIPAASIIPAALSGFATVKSPDKKVKAPKLELEDEITGVLMSMDDDSFQDKMMGYMEEKKLDSVSVYRASNMDRRLFAKVKRDGYTPSKESVLSLSVGLQLNLTQTEDLLSRAGYAFSPVSKRDAIIKYFIGNGDFYKVKHPMDRPIDKLNDYLMTYNLDALGD